MRKFNIFDEEGSYEYDVTMTEEKEGKTYRIFQSSNRVWQSPGKLVMTCVDNGDELKFGEKIGKKIDYSQMVELRILLSVIAYVDQDAGTQGKYTISEVVDTVHI